MENFDGPGGGGASSEIKKYILEILKQRFTKNPDSDARHVKHSELFEFLERKRVQNSLRKIPFQEEEVC